MSTLLPTTRAKLYGAGKQILSNFYSSPRESPRSCRHGTRSSTWTSVSRKVRVPVEALAPRVCCSASAGGRSAPSAATPAAAPTTPSRRHSSTRHRSGTAHSAAPSPKRHCFRFDFIIAFRRRRRCFSFPQFGFCLLPHPPHTRVVASLISFASVTWLLFTHFTLLPVLATSGNSTKSENGLQSAVDFRSF